MTRSATPAEPSPAVNTLVTIAHTLVSLGRYRDPSDAIKGLALEQVERKIALYRRRARRFEHKHQMSFDDFTQRLQGRASIAEEDEWFEWESALAMLEAWQKVKEAVQAC